MILTKYLNKYMLLLLIIILKIIPVVKEKAKEVGVSIKGMMK